MRTIITSTGLIVLAGCAAFGTALTGGAAARAHTPVPGDSPAYAVVPANPAPRTALIAKPAQTRKKVRRVHTPDDGTRELASQLGKELGTARSGLRKAGFVKIKAHDALGRGRVIFNQRQWRVCGQNPMPGRVSRDSTVDLAVAKLDESCPVGGDTPAPAAAAPGTMPNLIGTSLRVARGTLPRGTEIKIKDATGANRIAFRDTGWQVCSQTPAAGASLADQSVSFAAVKYGERCPGA
ncbi:hypothetical protein [Sinosporangium siamense]|uniref:PASTA domain-containing protein n=1 Tax=Sinosporangium siamense TaxID=1367973 RepID=A0A919V9G9_9ACTN|nr:hypothetical protein [Sinosporangium siamense]GII90124.1 hypothetical protein Ssi02_03550 [Sinosporangium siamense]